VFLSETPGEDIEFGLIRTCIDIHIDVTTYIPNYIHTCIWIDMHIYEHTHTHAHTRTHTPPPDPRSSAEKRGGVCVSISPCLGGGRRRRRIFEFMIV
jgi:hypothetical protein